MINQRKTEGDFYFMSVHCPWRHCGDAVGRKVKTQHLSGTKRTLMHLSSVHAHTHSSNVLTKPG